MNLNTSPTVTHKTGNLYNVVDLKEQPLVDTQWFETLIRVDGKHIRVWLAGENFVDNLEPENPVRKPNREGRLLNPKGGAIALRANDPESIWHFREIRLKGLNLRRI
ncbi:MAG: family 16 glycoside hydrolase [Verrucomicrobiota bacterium]|nr:family 16 glycoside hydrolase [Verrucomicrobiota bacterium]